MTGVSLELSGLAWPEAAGRPLVVLPVGSLEQHGPHLPLNTDAVIAQSVAAGLVDRLAAGLRGGSAVCAPPLVYAASGEHQGFPGTVSIGAEVMRLLVIELTRSLRCWSGPVVLVNAHGGNAECLREAVRQLTDEGHDVQVLSCAVPGADLHAGRTETSLMLHLAPWAVRRERVRAGCLSRPMDIMGTLRRDGVLSVSPSGVLGDPRGASAAEGRRILVGLVDRLASAVAARAGRTRR